MTETLTYRVDGMSCNHCVVAVSGEVGRVAGRELGRRGPRHEARPRGWSGRRRGRRGGRDRRGRLRRASRYERPGEAGRASRRCCVLVFGVAVAGGRSCSGLSGRAARYPDPVWVSTARPTRSAGCRWPRTGGCRSRSSAHDARARLHDPRGRCARARVRRRARAAHAPDRRAAGRHRLPAPASAKLGEDGAWRTPLTLGEPGAYRVFADFSHDGTAYTLAADVTVDGAATYRGFPAPSTVDTTDGYRVELARGGF